MHVWGYLLTGEALPQFNLYFLTEDRIQHIALPIFWKKTKIHYETDVVSRTFKISNIYRLYQITSTDLLAKWSVYLSPVFHIVSAK